MTATAAVRMMDSTTIVARRKRRRLDARTASRLEDA
jgi:hypothetical protein